MGRKDEGRCEGKSKIEGEKRRRKGSDKEELKKRKYRKGLDMCGRIELKVRREEEGSVFKRRD